MFSRPMDGIMPETVHHTRLRGISHMDWSCEGLGSKSTFYNPLDKNK